MANVVWLLWKVARRSSALFLIAATCHAADPKPAPILTPLFGAKVVDLDGKLAARVGLAARRGVVIHTVLPAQTASNIGLKTTDVLLKIDGEAIPGVEALQQWLKDTKPGQTYEFTVFRYGGRGRGWAKAMLAGQVVFEEDRSAEVAEWEAAQAKLPDDDRPYDVKGDRLGMSLDHFKAKHRRRLESGEIAPETSEGSSDDLTLLYESELAKAGIVHASLFFRFELKGHPSRQTIAGVPAMLFIYQFVDGQLYQVTIAFSNDHYDRVMESMKAKFELPAEAQEREYHWLFGIKLQGEAMMWRNNVSEAVLFENAGGREDCSAIVFSHKVLAAKAAEAIRSKVKVRLDDL